MGNIKLVIVEDYAPLRIGLRTVFENEEDLEVVADLADAQFAVWEVERFRPDVVVMNVHMPDMKGIEACRLMRERVPDVKVVMLTSRENEQATVASLAAGAHCLLLKKGEPDTLIRSVRAAARGEILMDPILIWRALDGLKAPTARRGSRPTSTLSEREREVLHLLAQMKTNREISHTLYISENTVKTHVSNILRKLELHSRYEIATTTFHDSTH